MEFKQDCRNFISDRPCKFHKLNSEIVCDKCCDFSKAGIKILIIKLAAIGDVVRTTAILKPLFKKYKNPQIFWVTYKESLPVLENNPYVKEKISYETSWQLIAEKFDILINLDLDKEALRLTKLLKAEEKVGFYLDEENTIVCSNSWAKKWFELSHNDVLKKKNKLTYQEFVLKICELDYKRPGDYPIIINLTSEEKQFARNFASKNGIREDDFVIGINTGGGEKWPKKEWPVKNTIEFINKIIKSDNLRIKNEIKILIFGGKKEKERNKKILENFKLKLNVIDTGNDNSLREFFALLNLCDLVVVTDSLALHVLLGLKKKVIVLFGPTSYYEIETYGLGKKIVSPMECVVCYDRNCRKETYCMENITADKVFRVLSKFFKI